MLLNDDNCTCVGMQEGKEKKQFYPQILNTHQPAKYPTVCISLSLSYLMSTSNFSIFTKIKLLNHQLLQNKQTNTLHNITRRKKYCIQKINDTAPEIAKFGHQFMYIPFFPFCLVLSPSVLTRYRYLYIGRCRSAMANHKLFN